MKRLALLLTLLCAPAAHAGWRVSPTVANGAPLESVAVAGNGTTVAQFETAHHVEAVSVDGGRPIPLGRFERPVLAAGRRTVFVGYDEGNGAMLARAEAGGQLGAPERIGPGRLVRLAADDHGGLAAMLERDEQTVDLRYRPAGGRFGRAVRVPASSYDARFVLSPRGEALVGAAIADGPFDVTARLRSGTADRTRLSAEALPVSTPLALAADGRGRVLAAWTVDGHIFTAVRSSDGAWSLPADTPTGAPVEHLGAAATRDGRAVVAWSGYEGGVRIAPASMASPQLGPPALTIEPFALDPLALGALPSGRILLAYVIDHEVRIAVMRRSGTFGTVRVPGVDPGNYLGIAGETRDGRASLWAGDRLVRETRR